VNQQQSEHDEVDVMKEKADSTGKVMHIIWICHLQKKSCRYLLPFGHNANVTNKQTAMYHLKERW